MPLKASSIIGQSVYEYRFLRDTDQTFAAAAVNFQACLFPSSLIIELAEWARYGRRSNAVGRVISHVATREVLEVG